MAKKLGLVVLICLLVLTLASAELIVPSKIVSVDAVPQQRDRIYPSYDYGGLKVELLNNTDECLINCEAIFKISSPSTLYFSQVSDLVLSYEKVASASSLKELSMSVLDVVRIPYKEQVAETYEDVLMCNPPDLLLVHKSKNGTALNITCYSQGYADEKSPYYQHVFWSFPVGVWSWYEGSPNTIKVRRVEYKTVDRVKTVETWVPWGSRSMVEGKEILVKVEGRRPFARLFTDAFKPDAVDWKIDVLSGIKPAWAWWSSSWTRAKMITLNASVSAGTQVKVTVTYDADMKASFEDIRFTDKASSDEYSFWQESHTDSTSAVYWVKVDDADDEFFMYYGNSGASSTSSGTGTFPDLFDDFADSSIATAIWDIDTETDCHVEELGGILHIHFTRNTKAL